jgi:8-oxo-dGTP diphosphatase
MKCTVYKLGKLKDYKYVVTFARYKNQWIICKHKNRTTWETSGGHIETGETPLEAAKRELYEETGSIDFEINPICDYWACDEPHETNEITWANGQVFLANVKEIGPLPDNEMECISFFETYPQNLTYPNITNELLPYIINEINRNGQKEIKQEMEEIKISEMLKSQYELWEKHKETWSPMKPESARNSLLWMMEEIGEVIAIIKKRGEKEIEKDKTLKEIFTEELVDVFMYFLDILNRYSISGEEFSRVFVKKNNYNQKRDFEKEHNEYKRCVKCQNST